MIKLEYLLPEGAELIQEGYDALMIEFRDGLREEIERCCNIAYDKMVWCEGEMVKVPRRGVLGRGGLNDETSSQSDIVSTLQGGQL